MKTTTLLADKKSTKMIAHRGLSGIETENTAAAFVAAGNRSYYGLECDVHVTRDGKYAIFHDDDTGRICDKKLTVEDSTLAELRALRFKDGDGFIDSLKVVTLDEYLRICSRYNKIAVVELKNRMSAANIAEIVDICKANYDLRNITFISFCFDNLVEVRKLCPEQTVQFLNGSCDAALIERLHAHKFDLDVYYECLTEELISALHAADVKVNCWTCDDKQYAEKLISWGIDYITTNILE